MKGKVYRAQRDRILALHARWEYALGLRWWTVTHMYDREGIDFAPAETDGGYRWQTAATCYPHWQYRTVEVKWNMPLVVACEDAELEYIYVHEMMHVLLHEMRPEEGTADERAHEERVASTLARLFITMRAEPS